MRKHTLVITEKPDAAKRIASSIDADEKAPGISARAKALKSSWKEYLREIAKNPLTGKWAREVAEQLAEMEKK